MKLKELVDINIGLSLERKKANNLSEAVYEYKMFSLRSFDTVVYLDQTTIEPFFAKEKINNQYFTEPNCVMVRLRAPVRALSIYEDKSEIMASSLIAKIRIIYPEILDSRYLAYFINSTCTQAQLMKNIQGTAVQMAKISDLQELEIILPTLAEQIQLVRLMDTAQQEIKLLNQLITQKQQLLSAVLNQQILTQMNKGTQ